MKTSSAQALLLAVFGVAVVTDVLAQAPIPVGVIRAAPSDWQDQIRAVGSLRSVQEVSLATEIDGRVISINLDSGARVNEGEIILRLDSRSEAAELADLEAQLELAELDLERLNRLLQQRSISEADVDAAQSRRRQLQAQIQGQRTLIDKKTLRAPFAGTLGLRQVNLGEVLEAGREVTTLQANDKLLVDFPVPQNLIASAAVGQPMTVVVDAYPDLEFAGAVTAIDARVNPDTRAVTVRGQVGNEKDALRPGMFVTVNVTVGEPRSVITLPSAAIIYSTFGDNIYVANEQSPATVERRAVKLGDRRGDQVVVTEGLTGGELVVVAGQIRLRDGATVTIDEAVEPFNDPNPTGVVD